mmetsp:Transcript_17410/g.25814  ORF Transcript_17410/g.25814 Transcript_17410/m.25814 type:complete len:90 (+) Transcript_17410:129-398(+)
MHYDTIQWLNDHVTVVLLHDSCHGCIKKYTKYLKRRDFISISIVLFSVSEIFFFPTIYMLRPKINRIYTKAFHLFSIFARFIAHNVILR